MGLFGRKTEVSIDGFCRQFYDSQVFYPVITGEDISRVWWDTIFNSLVEADESLSLIDKALFIREMTALRLELFALAWAHRFKHEKFTMPQSVFTRQYLEENGKLELWDIMGEYNQAIAQSATLTETREEIGGRTGRARITYINELRSQSWERWCADVHVDPSAPTEEQKRFLGCVARVANRIGADVKRNDCILAKRLSARLADRLKCDPNLGAEALFRLSAVAFGLYEGAREAIKDVSLHWGCS